MRIIELHVKPKKPRLLHEWWSDIPWDCQQCGCVFQPDSTDPVSLFWNITETEWTPFGWLVTQLVQASAHCPNCWNSIGVSVPYEELAA